VSPANAELDLTTKGNVITMSVPQEIFNFKFEALKCAVNEACAGENVECSIVGPCPECQVLASLIEKGMVRAFLAGQSSMQRSA
jgi:hypothetical protein